MTKTDVNFVRFRASSSGIRSQKILGPLNRFPDKSEKGPCGFRSSRFCATDNIKPTSFSLTKADPARPEIDNGPPQQVNLNKKSVATPRLQMMTSAGDETNSGKD